VLDCEARRGVAQSGSAPVWGTGGRRFKSGRPDHLLVRDRPYWPVLLVRERQAQVTFANARAGDSLEPSGNDTLRIAQMNVSLRPLEDRDLGTIYQQVTDPESVRMAAFTAQDQTDRR
jgi:hypothetical protein